MIDKNTICKELRKKGYSEKDGVRVWDISDRTFRYINPEMAEGFLKLREHPRYKANIVDIEVNLLKKYVADFLKEIGNSPFNLVDMGCADGLKAKAIIKSLPKGMKCRYCPVCVNDYFVNLSLKNLKKESLSNVADYFGKVSKDFESFDEVGAMLRNGKYQKNVYLLLGSLLASFEINDYLFRLSQSMLPGDLLLIGNGIRTGKRFANLETYKNPIFNEWFIHLMRQIEFKDDEVEYDARFENNRLEGFYRIKVDKKIVFCDEEIEFRKGDEIVVAIQYKWFGRELEEFCKKYFEVVNFVKDPDDEYALVACMK